MSSGNDGNSNDGNGDHGSNGGGSRGSKFLKMAGAVAATAAVAGGLLAVLLSAASASSERQLPFDAQREREEGDPFGRSQKKKKKGDPWPRHQQTPLPVNNGVAQMGWKKPDRGWVKLNVDGSRDHHKNLSAGCGGVLKDACGTWIVGFAQKVEPTFKAHQTELQAILTGLELAWERNVKKLVVESDSDSVVSMVEENALEFKVKRPEYDVVQRIRTLRFDPTWQVRLVSVPRKANRVANRLAKDARKFSNNNLRKYPDPPGNCTQLLLEDNAHGV